MLSSPGTCPSLLHLLSLQLSLEAGFTITGQSGDDKPLLPYNFSQTFPGVHWPPLNWPSRLVLCSYPAPKLEAFDADKAPEIPLPDPLPVRPHSKRLTVLQASSLLPAVTQRSENSQRIRAMWMSAWELPNVCASGK